MSDEVYVIQAISTGPDGYPYDEIAEIAVSRVDLDNNAYKMEYHNLIFYDPRHLGKRKLDYLSSIGGISPEEVYAGDPERKVAEDVLNIINEKCIASFDSRQEFGRYMSFDPWNITFRSTVMPSISSKMPISLKCSTPSDEPITIRKAYRRLLKNDPASVGSGRRAIHLAQMASELMIHMRAKGKY